ncbi:MAG: HEAT repeat domain-containing protein, partial [Verrucomicrobiota bacterium]
MMPRSVLCFFLLAGLARGDVDLIQSRYVNEGHLIGPTGISVSPRGVVYVSCDPNATTRTKAKVGKVVRCEDTDDDGVADRFTDFVSGIDSPRGSCFVDDVLYLMQPPFLVAYQDVDGDGVAEKNTVLVTHLGRPGAVKHGANGVRMGIDGWLYLAIGDQGCYEASGTDGSKVTLHGGGVLRVRPDGSRLSLLLTGTRNIYDAAVDPYLDLFARDNTNDGGGWNTRLHHLTELADFGYPHLYRNFGHEAMPSLADYGGGAGTGMLYLHEPGFPEDLGDALYSGDFNTGVAIHRRKPHGASWQVEQERFMDLPRNTGIDADGFSRMYCASWSGGGFGFAREAFGYVDRVEPRDKTRAAAYPEIQKAGDAELLTHLASPSQVVRINTMREMVTRGRKSIFTGGLLELAEDVELPLYARIAAVMTLKQLDGVRSHAALKDLYEDGALREFVVRALGDVASEIDGTGRKVFLNALKDEKPRVRMRAIVALARSGDVSAAAAILPLAKDENMLTLSREHRVLSHTALKAVVKLNAVDLLLRTLDDTELREAALRGLQEIHSE